METKAEVLKLKKILKNDVKYTPIKSPIKRLNYFWKDKDNKEITFKEFMSRFKSGIENITPLQRFTNEARGNLITLIGFIVALIAMIIYRDKFIVSWFAYGLILVFAGNIVTTGLRWLALRQQVKFFKNLEDNSIYLKGGQNG
ncbi:MAG TPA: hypothetical protein VJ438_05380 [Candidatus Nanoarchaeia archaeon]|nr:hypothetical protein [Candidatus Nanoarchaeia archaeon]